MKSKLGRPMKAKGEARTGMFALRLSEHDRAAIEEAAKRANRSVSEWARETLLAAAGRIAIETYPTPLWRHCFKP